MPPLLRAHQGDDKGLDKSFQPIQHPSGYPRIHHRVIQKLLQSDFKPPFYGVVLSFKAIARKGLPTKEIQPVNLALQSN
jgi:hypothetical protein